MLELAHRPPSRVSIPELLKQLQSTQDELENIRVSSNNWLAYTILFILEIFIAIFVSLLLFDNLYIR